MLDIEEEEDFPTKKSFKNRFIHHFLDTYNAKMGAFGNYIKTTQETVTAKYDTMNNKLLDMDHQLSGFTSLFQKVMANAHKETQEMDAKISFFNTIMDQQVDTASSRISQACTHYQLQINKFTTQKVEEFQQEIQQDLHEAVQSSIDNHLAPLFDEQTEALEQHGESLLNTLDDQAQKHTKNLEQYFSTMKETTDKTTPATSTVRNTTTRWSTVNLSQEKQNPPTDTYSDSSPDRDRWGQNVTPSSREHMAEQVPSNASYHRVIPRTVASQAKRQPPNKNHTYTQLNHYEFMKRAQVKYTGQPYVFYNKLRNIGQQYGVYLKPLNQIKYGFSLCPADHDGHIFDDEEYHQMAAALYKKFADTQCISEDCQRIRNIIDRYNEDNDGYQILYEIMEDAHPALKQDSIYRAPHSLDCDNNIKEYTARFQVFLTSETLKNRFYKPKEQVLHYLEGLDAEFNPAVTYIQTLMDSWGNADGLPPKCDM
jgi:hypothetical protein